MKFLLKLFIGIIIALAVFVIACNIWVISSTKKQVFQQFSELPAKKVALVLGTSKKVASGEPNSFFENRMQAAADLFHKGKIEHLIVSGDNGSKYYNEPADMKKALIARGVPEEAISLDYAGFRTLDSVLRCSKVFNQKEVIIITQEFHAYRALFISNYYDMKAVAFLAKDVPVYSATKVTIREFLARPKAVIDLYFSNNGADAIGETIEKSL